MMGSRSMMGGFPFLNLNLDENMEPANNASLNTSMETHKSSDIRSLIMVKIGWVPFLNLDPELANTRVLSLNTSMETNKSLDGRSLMDGGQTSFGGSVFCTPFPHELTAVFFGCSKVRDHVYSYTQQHS